MLTRCAQVSSVRTLMGNPIERDREDEDWLSEEEGCKDQPHWGNLCERTEEIQGKGHVNPMD